MMDLSAVVIIVAFSLVSAEDVVPQLNLNATSPNMSTSTSPVCSCPTPAAPTSKPSDLPIKLGFLKVNWTETCSGTVELFAYFNNSALPVCHNSETMRVYEILPNVCKDRKGCEYDSDWLYPGTEAKECYTFHANGASKTSGCRRLRVQCKVEKRPDFEGQLTACKVVIALLSIILLVLFLMRFTKPTVMALQKRLSDRRQHRWVGPTQSHSVSYHRGKSVAKNEDEEKRFSALERLTVGGGSSPSCNRNLYNY
uniref:PPUP7295 n=1 Tax=Poeciliopsis prolifica TaxID=188132 RepID=A0A0S7EZY3_9TELE